jgi:hypothetical protein
MEEIWLVLQKYPIGDEMGRFWPKVKRGRNEEWGKFGKICIFAFIPAF